MKIKSIKKIKNIGLLNEIGYTNSDLFLYHNKNDNQDKCYSKCLIKGNNGTGKTTFSNLLYSIEKNDSDILDRLKRIGNTEDINIEIELENGIIVRYDNNKKQWVNAENVIIRVFNEDYIKGNINVLDKLNNLYIVGIYVPAQETILTDTVYGFISRYRSDDYSDYIMDMIDKYKDQYQSNFTIPGYKNIFDINFLVTDLDSSSEYVTEEYID